MILNSNHQFSRTVISFNLRSTISKTKMSDIFNLEEMEASVDESSGFDLNFRIKRNEYAFEKDDQAWKWTPEKELRFTIIPGSHYTVPSVALG